MSEQKSDVDGCFGHLLAFSMGTGLVLYLLLPWLGFEAPVWVLIVDGVVFVIVAGLLGLVKLAEYFGKDSSEQERKPPEHRGG